MTDLLSGHRFYIEHVLFKGNKVEVPQQIYRLEPRGEQGITLGDAITLYQNFFCADRFNVFTTVFHALAGGNTHAQAGPAGVDHYSTTNVDDMVQSRRDSPLEIVTIGSNQGKWLWRKINMVSIEPVDDQYQVTLSSNSANGFTYLKDIVDKSLGDRFRPRLAPNSPAWNL